MDEKAKNRRPGGKGRLALIFFVLALALLATAACLFTVRVGGRLYVCADVADARGAALSCEEYDEAAARSGFKQIRWSVPIGAERYDSFSEILTLSSLPADEIGRLAYFPYLSVVDARGCEDYAALAAAAAEREDIRFLWTVPSSSGAIDGNAETLDAAGLGAEELEALLPLLPRLPPERFRFLFRTRSFSCRSRLRCWQALRPRLDFRWRKARLRLLYLRRLEHPERQFLEKRS